MAGTPIADGELPHVAAAALRVDDAGLEPISPELALVTPELAARARAALPELDPDAWIPRPFDRTASAVAVEVSEELAEPGFAHTLAQLVRWTLIAVAVAFLATTAMTALGGDSQPELVDTPAVVRPTVSWPDAEGADYYNFQLHRGGRKVWDAWLTTERITLPKAWTYAGIPRQLEPGIYIWFVWPGYGPRAKSDYGPLLRRGILTVGGDSGARETASLRNRGALELLPRS